MPCACSNTTVTKGTKKVILKNPRTGKKVAEISVPKVTRVAKGPVLLPGLTRIVKEETMRKYVLQSRRPRI